MLILSAFLVLLIGVFTKWALKRWRTMQTLQALGYAVPPVSFIGGNFHEIVFKDDLKTIMRWMTTIAKPVGDGKHGKIMGWYRGPMPIVYTSDPDILKDIFIKDSENFIDRPMMDRSDNIPHLLLLNGSRWKRVRSIVSPTFSALKMRRMSAVMSTSVDTLTTLIGKIADASEDANFYSLYQGLSLEVIGQCALAMRVNCQLDENDEFLKMVKICLSRQIDTTAIVAAFFPEVEFLCSNLFRGGRKRTNDVILSWCQDILDRRRKMEDDPTGETPIDSLQLMMDAAEGKIGESKKLTDEEITANAFVFILAGYETTATELSFTTYLLAHHPEVQEKLYEEISSVFSEDDFKPRKKDQSWADEFGEKILKLKYLEMVINESMRLFGPVPSHIGRWANNERTIKGYTIPAKSAVMAPIWFIHHDPDLWPDPWKFDPERFSPENKGKIAEMSFLPFGDGPRKCIGWRFAILESKIALVQILMKFRLEASEKTPYSLKYRNKGLSLAPEGENIFIRPVRR